MIRKLLGREHRDFQKTLIILARVFLLIVHPVTVQFFWDKLVGRLIDRFALQPFQSFRMFAYVSNHFLHRRELIVELAPFLIHPRQPAPDVETIWTFADCLLQQLVRLARGLDHSRLKSNTAGLFSWF